jgi:hypothetical protein
MSLNPLHEAHIREVAVYFDLTAPDLDPESVSVVLGGSHRSARRGDERRNVKGQVLRPHDEGWLQINTRGRVDSKDVNKHFRWLLERLLPHRDQVLGFANGETYFGVLWKSTYLYAGTGPMLDRDVVAGAAKLHAEIGFDIYQVKE